ncbi:chaplin family protein, partial [Streptomyces somaliensis]
PSGDTTRSPLDIPVNMCGGTVGAAGLLSPAFGDTCTHGG